MSKKKGSMELHDFYCINCGNRGIELPRNRGYQHKSFHRKKMYCIYCKTEVNHIECKSYEEVQSFKMNYQNGNYIIESKESLNHIC